MGILIYNGTYWLFLNYPYTSLIITVLLIIWIGMPRKKKKVEKLKKEVVKETPKVNTVPKNTNSKIYTSDRNKFLREMSKEDLINLFEDIVDAKFKAFGSPITICASDVLVGKIVGKTLDEALALTNKEIEDEIGLGVSPIKLHASVMAEEVISSAVADYRKKQEKLNKDA